MNEKFNENAKVEQLNEVVLSHGEEKGLIVKDPLLGSWISQFIYTQSISPIYNLYIFPLKHF